MPSHKIHIKIADEVNKKLKLDRDLYIIGSILPDLSNKIPHYKSHFKTDINNHGFYNVDLFLSEYDIDNPVIVGYLVHLLTDSYYNNYIRNNYFLYNENRRLNGIKMKSGNYYDNPDRITEIKQDEFNMYDNYLVRTNKYKEISESNIAEKLPIIKECDYDKDYIEEYINTYNGAIKNNNNYKGKIEYNILEQEELDNLFNGCIKYILDFLKDLKII